MKDGYVVMLTIYYMLSLGAIYKMFKTKTTSKVTSLSFSIILITLLTLVLAEDSINFKKDFPKARTHIIIAVSILLLVTIYKTISHEAVNNSLLKLMRKQVSNNKKNKNLNIN